MTDKKPQRDILAGELAGATIGDGLLVLPGQGNSLAAETDAGVVVLDASGPRHAPKMMAALRAASSSPVHAIVYSHGHHGYNAAVDQWVAHNSSRGEEPPRLVAQRNLVERYARYRETHGLQLRMASMQFPTPVPLSKIERGFALHDPSETFDDSMVLVEGKRRIELFWAPSEVHDSLAMWLPDDGLLCGGAATPGFTIPNVGTPLRTQRFTIRWADTLDRLAALGAERLLTEFGGIVEGSDEVSRQLAMTSEALRWVRDQVVDRMNRGMGEGEILADMEYPPALFDQPWMRPVYGDPDYIVRDLYREENGWWDRNPTTLHPASPDNAAAAVLSAVDPAAVVARARELHGAGEIQLALHVIDLVALAPSGDPIVAEARALKAELCRSRQKEVRPFVSKSLYETSARLLDTGTTSWTGIE